MRRSRTSSGARGWCSRRCRKTRAARLGAWRRLGRVRRRHVPPRRGGARPRLRRGQPPAAPAPFRAGRRYRQQPHADLLFQFAAGGFRDFTRIAGSLARNVARHQHWLIARRCSVELGAIGRNRYALRGMLAPGGGAPRSNASTPSAATRDDGGTKRVEAAEQQRRHRDG